MDLENNQINVRSWQIFFEVLQRRTTRDHGHEPTAKKKFSRQQENNAIVQHSVDKIILQDNEELSVEDETHEYNDSEMD